MNSRMGSALRQSLHVSGRRKPLLELLVDYTVTVLKAHLEKQFTEGMTWENHGAWHIDHIIPICAFNYESPGDLDFKRCWALGNLQPLWAEDNIKKGIKAVGHGLGK